MSTNDEPSTPRVSRVLKMLSSSLTPRSLTPRSRKRANPSGQAAGNVIRIPTSPMESPLKRAKIMRVIEKVPMKPIEKIQVSQKPELASPPITPQKSHQTQPNIMSSVTPKKLNFKEFITGSAEKSLVTPPVTPIKSDAEITIQQTNLTAKKLDLKVEDEEDDKENVTVDTLPTKSIYSRAKMLFQKGFDQNLTESLPQREIESQALNNFIKTNLINSTSSSLYISGPPGTGKTAQTNLTISQYIDISKQGVQNATIEGKDYKIGYTSINCMTITKVSNIFAEIYRNVTNGKKPYSFQTAKEDLLKLFTSDNFADMNIIVLDELDKLVTADQQILFELFSWTIFTNSKVILVGISNSLDMIDRLLPRLKINGLNPNTLSFMPYTADQIKGIIISKLKLLNKNPSSENIPVIHPAAIQLCAKKSSNNTGDLRKAFDICRNSIEMVERELRGVNSQGVINQDYSHLKEFDEISAPKVKISHIARICASVFDNHQSTRLKNLNLQQKFIICMLIKNEMELTNEAITINSLYEYYIKNINVDKLIGVLKKGEFLEVISALESIGVVKLVRAMKCYSQVRITSSISKKDLNIMVQGVAILEKLMNV